MKPNMTIGIAGHIDHGKTTLTKALTNIETDRLIEEKKRKISIENGYAFLDFEDGWRASVIDVPGHERFIRKMIAGVAGIDLVLLVIAADEGVMPQTKEHMDILRLLGISNAMVVITKMGLVDPTFLELVKEDIRQVLKDTDYENAPFYTVDSLNGTGINDLKRAIENFARTMKGRNINEPLRLPIDDVFTIHGFGTIVRGTIFNGAISVDSQVQIYPQMKNVRIKQLQVHHSQVQKAVAGQRVAVNIGGIDIQEVKRGDVLVTSNFYQPTKRLDVLLKGLKSMKQDLKQRGPVMVHIGTSSIKGRIILFDRNRLEAGETVHAQLELDAPIVAKKGDRFIVRRPSPVETIGGGEVINPLAEKHRYGKETVQNIERLAKGTPEEWIVEALSFDNLLTPQDLRAKTDLSINELGHVLKNLIEKKVILEVDTDLFVLTTEFEVIANRLLSILENFHQKYPLRRGMNKAEWMSTVTSSKKLIETVSKELIEENKVITVNHLICFFDFKPHYPKQWEKRLSSAEEKLVTQGLQPTEWANLVKEVQLPENIEADFRHYLIDQGLAYKLDENRLIHVKPVEQAINALRKMTGQSFSVQEAKEVLGLTRKHIIPFLELIDRLQLTKRRENVREWVK